LPQNVSSKLFEASRDTIATLAIRSQEFVAHSISLNTTEIHDGLARFEKPNVSRLIDVNLLNELRNHARPLDDDEIQEEIKLLMDKTLFQVLSSLNDRQILLDAYVMLLTRTTLEVSPSIQSDFSLFMPLLRHLQLPEIIMSGLVFKQSSNIFKGWRPFWIEYTSTKYLNCIPLTWKDLSDAGLSPDGIPIGDMPGRKSQHLTLSNIIHEKRKSTSNVMQYSLPLFSAFPVEISVSPSEYQFTIQYQTSQAIEQLFDTLDNYILINGSVCPYDKKFTWKTVSETSMVDWTIALRNAIGECKQLKLWIKERLQGYISLVPTKNIQRQSEDYTSWNASEDEYTLGATIEENQTMITNTLEDSDADYENSIEPTSAFVGFEQDLENPWNNT
jgi:hypothetical protein